MVSIPTLSHLIRCFFFGILVIDFRGVLRTGRQVVCSRKVKNMG